MTDPASLTLVQVKLLTENFLKKYHPSSSLPIPIEDIVELQLGIRIILINGLIKNFGVNAFITQSFDTIVIDEMMYSRQPERIRFTLAEEVGHLVLHRDWYLANGPKGLENYLLWQEKIDGKLFDFIERQAKTFASMILMPEQVLRDRWEIFRKKYHITSPCSAYDLTDTFPELAQEFAVSPDSLLVRLSFLKIVIVPDGFWRKIGKSTR